MKTLSRILLIAIVTLVGSGGHIGALPASDLDVLYYDQNFNWIGEHAIICSGAHYDWGEHSGAFRQTITESCNTDDYSKQCSYLSNDLTWTTYSCDEPPPCGFDVTCP
jgi:hypothetical protein